MASSESNGVPVTIPAVHEIRKRTSTVVQSSLDLVNSFSRSQQRRYGKLALGSAPSFAFTARSTGYGSVQDGEVYDEEDDLGSDEEEYEYDEEEAIDESREEDGASTTRGTSGFFFSDPVNDSPDSSLRGPRLKQVRAARRSFGLNHFNFTPTPERPPYEETPGTASLAQSPTSHIYHGPTGGDVESTPLLSANATVSTPQKLVFEETFAPDSVASRRPSTIGRGRLAGAAGRRLSTDRRSVRSRRSIAVERGESTDGQTLFNCVAVLVGIGILSMPLALHYMGWILGTCVLVGFGALTCHTAKLLAKLIAADPAMKGYTDLGKKAFGPWAGGAITLLFCLELFAYGLALIVLFGDSMNAIFPNISSDTWKFIVFFLIVPTTLMPLRLLSLPSILSTISSFVLIAIILIDGLGKDTAPGSLLHPAETNIFPQWRHYNFLGGIGFVLAGFGGHAVVPSLARDMKTPENFDRVINKAFFIASALGFVAGASGYLMIGNGVSDEITKDLMDEVYGYPRWLNVFALWMIVINPLTKFGLCSRPFNHTLEAILGINRVPYLPPRVQPAADVSNPLMSSVTRLARNSISSFRDSTPRPSFSQLNTPSRPLLSPSDAPNMPKQLGTISENQTGPGAPDWLVWKKGEKRKLAARAISRTLVTAACTTAAVLIPGFERVMGFMGNFSAFLITVILPISFYLALAPRMGIVRPEIDKSWAFERSILVVILSISVVFMVAGTAWAFQPEH
ncbi:putative amino acid transporter [Dioszegia hungarica]|uniref:Amino acid transporter n=1 Tax=Dioszegia hungarica TaxID=4972 RepID=A0AA38LY62_9TREE|nr:putative amino acid transporter [Dioszegia hungarica]KAI9638491.1 putative amino acid transporter [Dioszegia hungarica]